MPRTVEVTQQQLEWLDDAYTNTDTTFAEMARVIGCDRTTIKRILQRHGIAEFEGAKYQSAQQTRIEMWDRPCSRCGSTKPRPKWQYYCYPCGVTLGHRHDRSEHSD